MAKSVHSLCSHAEQACSCALSPSSVSQTLEELSFERGIWAAAVTGNADKVKSHLQGGTNANARDSSGYTALHYAARNGHLGVCAMLIEHGASVNGQTKGGATPLHRAAYSGHTDIAQLLIRSGADVRLVDSDGKTALHKAAERGHINIARMLLEYDRGLLGVKDNKGNVPNVDKNVEHQAPTHAMKLLSNSPQ